MNNERIEQFKQEINEAIVTVTTNKKKDAQEEHKYLKSFGYNLIFEGGLDGYIVENPETGKRAYCKHLFFNMSHSRHNTTYNFHPSAYYTKDKIDFVAYLNTPCKEKTVINEDYKRAFQSYQWRVERVRRTEKEAERLEKELAEDIERLVKEYNNRKEYAKKEEQDAKEQLALAKIKLDEFKEQKKKGGVID